MPKVATPRRQGTGRGELALVGVVVGIWVWSWGILTLAVRAAGGTPTVSLIEFLDPARLVRQYHDDGGTIVVSHLVGGGGSADAAMVTAILGSATVAITVAVGLTIWHRWCGRGGIRSRLLAPRGLRGTSRWASWPDLRRLRTRSARPGTLALGRRGRRLLATEKETSVLVVGPTRSGKTTALIIPNLFTWAGPAIVTSTKSELVDITAGHRQSMGPVYVYDPTGEIADLYPSVTWSPLTGCESLDRAWMTASWLCAGLQQGGAKSDNDWSHWAESGKLLIAPLMYCAAMSPSLSIVDVRDWIHGFDVETPLAVLHELAAGDDHANSDPRRAIGMLSSIDQRPEKERGTVFSTVTRIFSVFNERAVAESAAASRFSATELCERRGTLYLCTPRQAPERVASLFVGILMTVVTHAYLAANHSPGGRLQPELGLFLDELANVVPIEELPAVASQGAGRGVILMSIIQDMSQLRLRYGAEKANSILNNHGAKLFLPGISDPETCDLVAKLVGRGEYTDVSLSDQNGRTSRSYTVRRDHMASPEALRQLSDGTAILLYRGSPPTIIRLRPWFRSARFRALAGRHFFRHAEQVTAGDPGSDCESVI